MKIFILTLLALTLTSPAMPGWDLSNNLISTDEILSGGPPKDGIPALDEPVFAKGAEAAFMSPDERVLGFSHKGEARAYPLRYLSWHELVNDMVAGDPVLVNW